MARRECKETRELCKRLRELGAVTYAAVASRYSRPGWPDRWVGHRRWSGWLEFKRWDGVVDAAQAACMRDVAARSGRGCYVVWLLGAGSRVADETGETTLGEFDGTAEGLLACLERVEGSRGRPGGMVDNCASQQSSSGVH